MVERISLERAFEIRDEMIQVARNCCGGDGATQSEMREAQGEWLHGVLNELVASVSSPDRAGEPANYADFQQRRGRLPDLIEEAIAIHSDFMADDDFDAYGCLDKTVTKLKSARDFYDSTKKRDGTQAQADAAPDLYAADEDAIETLHLLRDDLIEEDRERHAQRIAVINLSIAKMSAALSRARGEA